MADMGDERQPGAAARQPQALRVMHLVPGLGVGGAEQNLLRLVQCTATGTGATPQQPSIQHTVVNLGLGGELTAPLSDAGAQVLAIDLKHHPLAGLRKLRSLAQELSPHLLQGWLYKGSFLASITARLVGAGARRSTAPAQRIPVVWSIRHSLQAWQSESLSLRMLVRWLGRGPFAPRLVVFNGLTSQQTHTAFGFGRYPAAVVGNLVAGQDFSVAPELRVEVRNQLGVQEDQLLVGLVARDHAIKNVAGFLQLALRLQKALPNARFVLAGAGLGEDNETLKQQIHQLGLGSVTQALGVVTNPAGLYNALDLLVSTSFSEGTSNVLLEATACGCACVATQVGAAAELLPAAALVAPASSTEPMAQQSLAQRMAAVALPLLTDAKKRRCIVANARQALQQQHDPAAVVAQYHKLYAAVAANQSFDAPAKVG